MVFDEVKSQLLHDSDRSTSEEPDDVEFVNDRAKQSFASRRNLTFSLFMLSSLTLNIYLFIKKGIHCQKTPCLSPYSKVPPFLV